MRQEDDVNRQSAGLSRPYWLASRKRGSRVALDVLTVQPRPIVLERFERSVTKALARAVDAMWRETWQSLGSEALTRTGCRWGCHDFPCILRRAHEPA